MMLESDSSSNKGNSATIKQKNWRIRHATMNGLVAVYLAQLVPHLEHLPVWLSSFLFGLGLFRLGIHRGYLRYPPKRVLTALVLLANVVFFLFYRINFSVEMAVAFLLLGVGFKFLEIQQKRDCFLFVFTLLYLSATAFLFDQGIITLLYQFLCILGALGVLMTMHTEASTVKWSHFVRLLARIGLVTAPLVIVLFLFFPRMSPLWSIPLKNGSAISGISSSMTPGDIAGLAQSSERAFRVSFNGPIPPRRDLYWRGIILDRFDGSTWTASERLPSSFGQKIETAYIKKSSLHSYRVLLEPSYQRWGFALAGSQAESSNIQMNEAGLVRFKTEVAQVTRYQLSLNGSRRVPSMPVRRQDLQIPLSTNPKSRVWLKNLKQQSRTPGELVQRLMNHFSREEFFYTLKPPTTGKDFVDEFLFDTRRGFCSHYAGSLAFLLRLAGIPARVVVGYQGGEVNEDGNYLIVHQYDAHAWVEAYIDGQGWVRLDPTAMVAPSRIESGLEQAVAEEGSFLSGNLLSGARYNRFPMVRWIRWKLDALNYQWQKWVVGYDPGTQYNFLSGIFGDFRSSMLGGLLIVSGLGIFGVWIWLTGRNRSEMRHNAVVRRYLKYTRRIEKLGIARRVGESPLQFQRRVRRSFTKPELLKGASKSRQIQVLKKLDVLTRDLIKREYRISQSHSQTHS